VKSFGLMACSGNCVPRDQWSETLITVLKHCLVFLTGFNAGHETATFSSIMTMCSLVNIMYLLDSYKC
jgi:hypothetical protein